MKTSEVTIVELDQEQIEAVAGGLTPERKKFLKWAQHHQGAYHRYLKNHPNRRAFSVEEISGTSRNPSLT